MAIAITGSFSMWLAGTRASGTAIVKVEGGYAWGNNATGELDDRTTTERTTPTASVGLAGVITMSAGLWHCLALRMDGSVVAWGHNASGELGDGTTTDRTRPVSVARLSDVRQVSSGETFSLAVRRDGSVFAWGNNASGELGDGKAPTDSITPIRVSGLGAGSRVIAISAGGSSALALKADGTVLAWGNNASGQLGNGNAPTDSATPVQVNGLGAGSRVIAISAGGAFSLALKSDGTVLAWGNNQSGELGDGTAPNDHSTPVHVSGLRGVTKISAGRAHALALTGAGGVFAWGDNTLGQVGDGSGSSAHKPVAIHGFGGHRIRGVFAGGDHSHALFETITKSQPPSSPSPSKGGNPTGTSHHGSPSPSPTRAARTPSASPPPVEPTGASTPAPGSTSGSAAQSRLAPAQSHRPEAGLAISAFLAAALLLGLSPRSRGWLTRANRSALARIRRRR